MRIVFCLATLLAASGASGQTDWRPVGDGGRVSIDVLAAQTSADLGTNGGGSDPVGVNRGTSTFSLLKVGVRVPLGERFAAVGSLPLALVSLDEGLRVDESSTSTSFFGIGNPYLGVEVAATPEASVEAGVFLPFSSDQAFDPEGRERADATLALAGVATDFEHLETYEGEVLTARLRLGGAFPLSSEATARASVAPLLSAYIGELPLGPQGMPVDTYPRYNAALVYGAFVDGTLGAVTISGGALGRYDPDGGRLAFAEPLSANLLAGVSADLGSARAGALVRVNLQGFGGFDPILGLSLDVPLR